MTDLFDIPMYSNMGVSRVFELEEIFSKVHGDLVLILVPACPLHQSSSGKAQSSAGQA